MIPSPGKCLTIPKRDVDEGGGQLERTGENRARGIPGEEGYDLKWPSSFCKGELLLSSSAIKD